jgi:hypothetical protein
MRSWRNSLAVVFIASLGILNVVPAMAQRSDLPPFTPSQHVYANFDWRGSVTKASDQQLITACAAQHLACYAVFTTGGSSAGAAGPDKADELYNLWSTSPAFPAGNYLLIVVIHANDGRYPVGVKIAPKPHQYVTTQQLGLATQHNRPILLPHGWQSPVGDANGYIAAIATEVSRDISASYQTQVTSARNDQHTQVEDEHTRTQDQHIDHQRTLAEQQAHDAAMAKLPGQLFRIFLVIFLLALVIFRFVQWRKLASQLKAVKDVDDPIINNTKSMKLTVEPGYKGLLTQDRDFAPKGTTYADYKIAKTAWAKMAARLGALQNLQKVSDAAAHHAIPVLFNEPLKKALALRTTETLTITGKEVSNGELDPYVGFYQKESLNPRTAVKELADNFKTANSLVAAISKAISDALQNGRDAEAIFTRAKVLVGQLESEGVLADHLDAQLADFTKRTAAIAEQIQADPKEALTASAKIKGDLELYEKELKEALEIKHAGITELDNAIFAAQGKVKDARVTIALIEDGGNPDVYLAQAQQLAGSMKKDLLAGDIEVAESEFDKAHAAVDQAIATIAAVQADKKAVEEGLPGVKSESTDADKPTIETINAAFANQAFVAARKALSALQTLQANRKSAKTKVGNLQSNLATVRTALHQATNFTSKNTDNSFNTIEGEVEQLAETVNQSAADWAAVEQTASNTQTALNAVSAAIAADVAAHSRAVTAVSALRQAYDEAAEVTRDKRVQAAAKGKLASATSSLGTCERNVKSLKQDWANIAALAGQAAALVAQAKQQATEDISEDEKYQQELTGLQSALDGYQSRPYTRTIRGTTYGSSVRFDSADALRHRLAAEQYYRDRDYVRMQAEIAAANTAAQEANMTCWWLTLEELHQSSDSYAQRYAYEAGYHDGQFDSWRDNRASGTTGGDGSDWHPVDDSNWQPSVSSSPSSGDSWAPGGSQSAGSACTNNSVADNPVVDSPAGNDSIGGSACTGSVDISSGSSCTNI